MRSRNANFQTDECTGNHHVSSFGCGLPAARTRTVLNNTGTHFYGLAMYYTKETTLLAGFLPSGTPDVGTPRNGRGSTMFKISLPRFGRLQDTRPSQLSSGRPALASFPRERGAGFILIFPAEGNYLARLKPPGARGSPFPICNPRRQPGPHYGLNREVLLAACRLPLFSATRRPESNRQTLALSGMHRVPAARPCWRTSLAAISNIAKMRGTAGIEPGPPALRHRRLFCTVFTTGPKEPPCRPLRSSQPAQTPIGSVLMGFVHPS